MAAGYSVLFEGAQATLLDIDHGTYPFVTSSSAAAGGAATRPRRPAHAHRRRRSASRRPTRTRVGTGPLPTEIGGELEEEIRERGQRVRRHHRPPAPLRLVRRRGRCATAVRVNGFDSLALTKLDVLDGLARDPGLHGLPPRGRDAPRAARPTRSVLEACEPVYETLPGWNAPTAGMREWKQLPDAARRYVDRLAELSGCAIGIVSTGPDRDHTIRRSLSADRVLVRLREGPASRLEADLAIRSRRGTAGAAPARTGRSNGAGWPRTRVARSLHPVIP